MDLITKYLTLSKGRRRDGDGDGFVSAYPGGPDNIPVIPGRIGNVRVIGRGRQRGPVNRRKVKEMMALAQPPRPEDDRWDGMSGLRTDKPGKRVGHGLHIEGMGPLGDQSPDAPLPSSTDREDPVPRYAAEKKAEKLLNFYEKFNRLSDDSWAELEAIRSRYRHHSGGVWDELDSLLRTRETKKSSRRDGDGDGFVSRGPGFPDIIPVVRPWKMKRGDEGVDEAIARAKSREQRLKDDMKRREARERQRRR